MATRRRALSVIATALLAGCSLGDSSGDPGPFEPPFEVSAENAPRDGDGELTIRYRPEGYNGFQWEGAPDSNFYGSDEGTVYLVVQMELSASGRPLEVGVQRGIQAVADGSVIQHFTHTGELQVDEPVEPGSPITGWKAWQIDDDISTLTLRHDHPMDIIERSYTTSFERDENLDLSVTGYSP